MTRQNWRNQIIEEAIEPDLRIIDAHHHVWEVEPYPPFDPYTELDLFSDLETCGHAIVGTVFVDSHTSYRSSGPETLKPVGETDYAERIFHMGKKRGGRSKGACAAIAPSANLLLGSAVGETLDAHAEASPRFRGIRHMTAYDLDVPASHATGASVMRTREFVEGFKELSSRGLHFEAWLLQPQLPEVIELADAFPQTVIVLNHLGGPMAIGRFAADKEAAFASWRAELERLAERNNIRVKLGGLNMGLAGVDALARKVPFTSEEMADVQGGHILTAVDLFGPERCMFESNVPVDTHGAGYGIIWNAFKRVTSGFSTDERARLFAGTAIETYRIDQDTLNG